VKLLVLFGSRVRGQVHPHSDWDFGYLAGEHSDVDLFRERLVQAVGTESIDLVNLACSSSLLRMRVAAEGEALFESEPGLFKGFQAEAARFWCDVEPVLSRAYTQILGRARCA